MNVILSAMLVLERSDRDILCCYPGIWPHIQRESTENDFLGICVTVSRFETCATRLRFYIVTAAPFYSLLATSQLNFHVMGHNVNMKLSSVR